jgi:hypothetical protein
MVSTALKRSFGVSRTLSPWFSFLMPLCFGPWLALHFEDCFVNIDEVLELENQLLQQLF